MRSEPLGLIGSSIGRTTSWPGPLLDRGRDVAERAAVDRRRVDVDEALLRQLARDERDAAGAVDVDGVEAAPRLHVGEHRRPRGDPVEVVDRERDPELARDREQVQDAVRRAAGGGDRGGRVLERLARDDLARPHVAADEVDRRAGPRPRPPSPCASTSAGMPFAPAGERPMNSRIVDIVLAVNWPPHAPAPGQATDSSSCSSSAVMCPAA